MSGLPLPEPGDEARWVGEHLGGLFAGPVSVSQRFRGGQTAADAALDAFAVRGYASRRSKVWPVSSRGASGLSPWIRHGLITREEAMAKLRVRKRDYARQLNRLIPILGLDDIAAKIDPTCFEVGLD